MGENKLNIIWIYSKHQVFWSPSTKPKPVGGWITVALRHLVRRKKFLHYSSTCKHTISSSGEGVSLKCNGEHSGWEQSLRHVEAKHAPDDVPLCCHNHYLYLNPSLSRLCGVSDCVWWMISWSNEVYFTRCFSKLPVRSIAFCIQWSYNRAADSLPTTISHPTLISSMAPITKTVLELRIKNTHQATH